MSNKRSGESGRSDGSGDEMDDPKDSDFVMGTPKRKPAKRPEVESSKVIINGLDFFNTLLGSVKSSTSLSAKQAHECTQKLADGFVSAELGGRDGDVGQILTGCGQMMGALSGNRLMFAGAAAVKVTTEVQTDEKDMLTLPGSTFPCPDTPGMKFYAVVRGAMEPTASDFKPLVGQQDILTHLTTHAVLVYFPLAEQGTYSPCSLTTRGLKEVVKSKELTAFFSVKKFLLTKPLERYTPAQPKASALLLGDLDKPTDAETPNEDSVAPSIQGRVSLCLSPLDGTQFVVPMDLVSKGSQLDVESQLKGIAKSLNFQDILTDLSELAEAFSEDPGETLYYNKRGALETKVRYVKNQLNPFFGCFVVEKIADATLSISGTTYKNEDGKEVSTDNLQKLVRDTWSDLNGNLQQVGIVSGFSMQATFQGTLFNVQQHDLTVFCSLEEFASKLKKFTNPAVNGSKAKARSGKKAQVGELLWTDFSTFLSAMKSCVTADGTKLKIGKADLITCVNETLYPKTSASACNLSSSAISIFNIAPYHPDVSVEEVAVQVNNVGKQLAPDQKAITEIVSKAMVFVARHNIRAIPILGKEQQDFKQCAIGEHPMVLDLDAIIAPVVGITPDSAQIHDFFKHLSSEPEVNEFRECYKFALMFAFCKKSVSMATFIKSVFHKPEADLGATLEVRKEASDLLQARLYQCICFWVCIACHCSVLWREILAEYTAIQTDIIDFPFKALTGINGTSDVMINIKCAINQCHDVCKEVNLRNKDYDQVYAKMYTKEYVLRLLCTTQAYVDDAENDDLAMDVDKYNAGVTDEAKAALKKHFTTVIEKVRNLSLPNAASDDSDDEDELKNAEEACETAKIKYGEAIALTALGVDSLDAVKKIEATKAIYEKAALELASKIDADKTMTDAAKEDNKKRILPDWIPISAAKKPRTGS